MLVQNKCLVNNSYYSYYFFGCWMVGSLLLESKDVQVVDLFFFLNNRVF